jgi:hypothetical protein
MTNRSGMSHDLEILLADGATWLPLMLAVPRADDGTPTEGAPKTLTEVLAAYENDLQLSKRLTADVQEDWFGGVGVSYNVAPGVYTRTQGYAMPAGAVSSSNLSISGASSTRIVAIKEFNGNSRGAALWAAQVGDGTANTARILRYLSSTNTLSRDYALGAGTQYFRGLEVFDNGSGTKVLFAGSSNSSSLTAGTVGYMHKLESPGTWTQSPVMSGRNSLTKVFWVDQNGVGAWRLVAIDGPGSIAYTVPNADPMVLADWVEGVPVDTTGLLTLAAARRSVFMGAQDGLFTINELGDTPNLTSYMGQAIDPYSGMAVQYHDGYVYISNGFGLDRVRVDTEGTLQENPGQCSPGWGTRAEHEFRGFTSAMCVDQGWLVNATYNTNTARAAIWYGRDRQIVGVDTPNPMVWHGPEITGTTDLMITAMCVSTAGIPGGRRLFFAAIPYVITGTPWFGFASIPPSGGSIDDLISGGVHRFATGSGSGTWNATSRLHLLDEGFGDRTSLKILHQHAFETRGLSIGPTGANDGLGTKLTLETRADAAPGSTTWTTSDNVTASPSTTVTPSTVVSGYRIGRRISFVNPSGGATPPAVGVLDAVRTTAWKIQPSVGVRVLEVEYGDGVADQHGGTAQAETYDPDWVTTQLLALPAAGRTTLRDRQGKRYTVHFEQVLDREEKLAGGVYGKTVRARLEVNMIEAL